MGDVIQFEVTGGYMPPADTEKLRTSNASLAAGHRRMQLEIQSLQQENAMLREQVTQSQALAFRLKREIGALRLALREFGVEL